LVRSLQQNGRVEFTKFYARRARRNLIWIPPSLRPGFLRDADATAVYIPNVFFALSRVPLARASRRPP
jgi:hypothetical protein